MGTFVNLGLISLETRFAEIDRILNEADNHFNSNQDLYNSLCRSAQVLLSAHFEGYLKDLVKNSIDDINRFSSFKLSNKTLKRLYCEHFILLKREDKPSHSLNRRIEEMVAVFDELETKFDKNYFSYSDNQNPKVTVLDKIAEQYGIKNFFDSLKRSKLNEIFSNTLAENIELKDRVKSLVHTTTVEYPYSLTLDYLEINMDSSQPDNLWNEFLNDMLKRRHDIAHGRELENSVDVRLIKEDRVKVEILLYAFTSFVCVQSNPLTAEEL